jgi:hypothetical protein
MIIIVTEYINLNIRRRGRDPQACLTAQIRIWRDVQRSGNYMYHLYSPKLLHFRTRWIHVFHLILKTIGDHSLINLLIFVMEM